VLEHISPTCPLFLQTQQLFVPFQGLVVVVLILQAAEAPGLNLLLMWVQPKKKPT
jgi:hypothetical protein